MTKLLLVEVEKLLDEVSTFVQSCCNIQPSEEDVNVIEISERLSHGTLLTKVSKIQVNNVIPTLYKESLFSPFQKKALGKFYLNSKFFKNQMLIFLALFVDIMDVEQSVINTVFQEEDELSDSDLPAGFPEDLPDDFKLEESFPPAAVSTLSGYPEPTLVPGKEGGKIKTFYKCEKCNKSFPKRKRYYNHKVGLALERIRISLTKRLN